MKYILLLLCMVITGITKVGAIKSYSVIPAQPTIADNISIAYCTNTIQYPAWFFGHNFQIYGDTVFITSCVRVGPDDWGQDVYDTVNIGMLPPGTYTGIIFVNFTGHNTDSACLLPFTYDSVHFSFTVTAANAVTTDDNDQIKLLDYNHLEVISGGNAFLTLSISNTSGQLIYHRKNCAIGKGANVINIELPQLTSGIYLYQIQAGDRVRILKLAKY